MAFHPSYFGTVKKNELRLEPNAPAVALHDPLADRQADARARVFIPGVQALEDHEQPLRVLGIDPDPVVLDGEDPRTPVVPRRHVDPRGLAAAELDRVRDQVLEHQHELRGVGAHRRQIVVDDQRLALLDGGREVPDRLAQGGVRIGRLDRLAARPDPGVGQQVVDLPLQADGAVHRVADVLLGLVVELLSVTLGQELRVARDHPQRLLQVVRGDVGELLEFLVGAREVEDDGCELVCPPCDELLEVLAVLAELGDVHGHNEDLRA
jgi:hypothetical protein